MTRRGTRWGVAPLVLAMLLLTGGAVARGDACSDCGPPTLEDLEKEPGFVLEKREGQLDDVHLHAGECRITLVAAPKIKKAGSRLVLRGAGAVWKCPSSSASDVMTASTTQADQRAWAFSASASATASLLGVGLSAEVVATVSANSEITEVTTISKTMTASWCRVIGWKGYFEVAEYVAEVTFKVKRRYAWWTKNLLTGWTVHRKGEMWLDCGVHTATLDAKAPISGYFELTQTQCPDPQCNMIPSMNLGFFPPLPPGLLPPTTPGDGEEKEEEEKSPDDDGETPSSEENDDGDGEIPPSDDLGDPPAGPLPYPPGFEPKDDEEGTP